MNFSNIHEILFNPFDDEILTNQLFSTTQIDSFKKEYKPNLNPYCYALSSKDNPKTLYMG